MITLKENMTKKEIVARKNFLAYKVHNIRLDYAGVDAEDMPADVTAELDQLMTEMKALRAELDAA